jgi:CRP/FNR family transcriptional regulator
LKKPDCSLCALRASGFCGTVEEGTRCALSALARIQTLPANSVVWDDAREPEAVGLLLSGYMRYQRYGMDGRRQILCVMQPGDIVGDPQDMAAGYALETSTEVKLCRFERRPFERLLQTHPDLSRALYRQRSARLDKLRWLTWSLGALSAEQRLCAFLVQATTHMPFVPEKDGGILSLVMPRRDIADLLATTVESISRTTQKLDAEGVLEILSPVSFRIADLGRLATLGGDVGGVVLRPGRLLSDPVGKDGRQKPVVPAGRRLPVPLDSRQCPERAQPLA